MRLDIATSEWHKLIKPVLPHASTDKELPERQVVRIEAALDTLYAIAGDGYTLAAERLCAPRAAFTDLPVHIKATEAKASLALFPFSKDEDPIVHLIIDTVPVPIEAVGQRRSVNAMAVTIQRGDGTRLAMHDQRDPSRDPLAKWQAMLYKALAREQGRPFNGLDLRADVLGRWASAARGGERLCIYSGPEAGDPLLITVEDHFAGIWAIPPYLDGPGKRLSESPWLTELHLAAEMVFDLRTASGVHTVNTGTGEVQDSGDDGD